MKISVIIPIFKVEQYLKQCVESVLKQTYRNIEVILVDDGSPDKSPAICDEFSKIDKRVVVIHKKNGGLSDARNAGIHKATGEYIIFLDGDDFWDDLQGLQKLVARVRQTKVDVLNYSYKKYFEDTGEIFSYIQNGKEMPSTCNSKTAQINYLTGNSYYIASACNKMIRRSLFKEKLFFEQGVFSEDIEWCAKLLYYAESFDFICEDFYCYRQRKDSIRHTISKKKCVDLKNNILKCIEISKRANDEWKNYFYRYVAFQYATFFMVQAQAEEVPYEEIAELSKFKWILKYHGNHRKVKYLYYMSKMTGYRNACRLIRMVY